VTIYAVDPADGSLTTIGWQPAQGRDPRFIGLDPTGRFLYAANEQGDSIVAFRVDARSGKLVPTGQVINTKSPVTIIFFGNSQRRPAP